MTAPCLTLAWAIVLAPGLAAGSIDRPEYLGPKPPAKVSRVVTLAPSLTETVEALGALDRVVGVSRFDESLAVAQLPRVGGFVDPNVEAIVALRPDLLLVQPAPGNRRPVEKLAELGISVLALPMHTVAQVEAALLEAGQALGRRGQAKKLCEEMEGRRQRVRERARRIGHVKRVLVLYGFEPLVVGGPGSFADELLADVRATNVAHGATSAYPTYPVEAVVRMRPEVVINAAAMAEAPERLRTLPGLEKAQWSTLSSQALLHPGPRLGEAVEELFRLVHPEVAGGKAP